VKSLGAFVCPLCKHRRRVPSELACPPVANRFAKATRVRPSVEKVGDPSIRRRLGESLYSYLPIFLVFAQHTCG
jgi:hypothetical protein